MRASMSFLAKRELLARVAARYRCAPSLQKSVILCVRVNRSIALSRPRVQRGHRHLCLSRLSMIMSI